MQTRKLFFSAAAMLLMAGAVNAQDQWKSYTYVEAQGGIQLTSTNAPMDKLLTPTAALSLGHYFTPVVGARLHVNAWESKSGFKDLDQYYKWKYVTPDIDLMLNLSNLFCQNTNHSLNVILLGGVGLNYAWDNDELKDLNVDPRRVPLKWDDNRFSHNLRAGLRLETNMSKPLGLSLEVNANSLSDRFNSKTNDRDDWQFTAMLGLNFRFGQKAQKPRTIEREIEEEVWEDVPVKKMVTEKKPVAKMRPVKLHKEVFYAIRVSENETPSAILEQVAKFMKENKDAKIMVVGYADKGTGNARLNKMYAQKRAETFKKDLVEKYNCNADMITIDSKGDTVQPFEENDKNRCVIIDGEGQESYTDYEEVQVEKEVMEKQKKIVKRIITETVK
ncbi:MAG: OmpA family protein [Prevotella sp.]|nr:OmpA family protein [Prevotella sp.]